MELVKTILPIKVPAEDRQCLNSFRSNHMIRAMLCTASSVVVPVSEIGAEMWVPTR
jgi:hypothetical protein